MSRKLLSVLLSAVACGVILACGGADPTVDCFREAAAECRAVPPTMASPQEELVARYAPILYLREQVGECDRPGGAYEPRPVEMVLENPDVTLRHATGSLIVQGPTASDLFGADVDSYLDFPGNPRRPGCRYVRDFRRFGADHPAVAYAHIVRSVNSDELALQYWFFYYFNDWNNKHEGDWERIQVVFDAISPAEALTKPPIRIAYSGHRGGEIALWTDKKVRLEGHRPVVYVAAGSHASFFGPHIYIGRAETNAGFGCDDASPPHRRVAVEARLVPARVTDQNHPFAWLAFKGRWGELAGPEFDGPTGPATKEQWQDPTDWEEGLRNSSVRVPSRRTIGPNAVDAFCTLVASGSEMFLPIVLELPLVSAVLLGGFALVLVGSLTRTRYVPIQARPLRGRRRIGQILLSAMEVYRRRARLFLGIGLVFVPATALVSAAHWLVLNLSPVDPVVRVPTSNVGQEVILVFALAELQFGLAYTLVIAAATAALASYESGSPTSVEASFREVMRRLPHLALPRLGTVLVIGALAFTIVGLPLALRQAVRWIFLEQAVLLDHSSGLKAFNDSSAAVAKDWWWSAAATMGLALVGLATAPALGIALILAYTSLPLGYVHVLSSAVYVALVPYVAIALAMVYFDLKARVAEPRLENREDQSIGG